MASGTKDAAQVIAELTATNANLREQIKSLEKTLWKRDHPVLRRALSVSDVMRMKKETYPFEGAWEEAYDSLEEGASLTMKNALMTAGMQDVARRFVLLDRENMQLLSARLGKHKSPDIVVIDSFQYTKMSFKDYEAFKERHANKLLIFVSQADGNKPAGRTAVSVMYDASLKIFVSGFRAISKGRYFGSKGYYTIWEERAKMYWGEEQKEK